MSRHDDHEGDAGADPLADLFAAEREQVRSLPADEVRWQRIARAHRTRGGTRRRYAAAAAAVVVVGSAVGVATSLRHGSAVPAAEPTVTRTVYVEAPAVPAAPSARVTAPASVGTTAPGPSAATTAGVPSSTAVPADFTVLSLTTVASGRVFALGSASCAGRPCALVATSADRGATWAVRGTVPGERAVPRVSEAPAGAAELGSGSGVTDVRFASDTVGWVFGRTVLRTTDGGRTWAPYDHGSTGPVLALETDGDDVVLASAASCGTASCTGGVTVSRAAAGASSAATVGSPLPVGQGLVGLDLAWRQHAAILSVRATGRAAAVTVTAVAGSTLTPLTPPDCAGGASPSTVAAPADGSGLVLFCGPGTTAAAPGPVFTGDGTSWTQVSDAGPTLTASTPVGGLSAAAVDPGHLVLATAGSSGSSAAGALAVSSDAGRTWRTPPVPSTPAGGFAWVGSPGGRTYYALASRPGGSFWRSDDAGESWRAVAVR